MKKYTVSLTVSEVGTDKLWGQLGDFVKENFKTLWIGASRLSADYCIPGDYYAPRRIQINKTRLHEFAGLKYAAGHHKYDEYVCITEAQLRETVSDLQ